MMNFKNMIPLLVIVILMGASIAYGIMLVNSNVTLTQTAKLVASDTAAADYFGSSVSVSSDGSTVLIGSSNDDTGSGYDTGSAYVFESVGDEWMQTAKLVASDTAAADYFGSSVSLSSDGTMALVGSRVDDASEGIGAGSVYVFTLKS